MVASEHKIKDVCGPCNHGVLSELDNYGKQLLLDAGALTPSYSKLTLALRYDYDFLCRWLLKISFNSSRTDGAHRHLFEGFVPFILGQAPAPQRYELALFAFLASPTVPEVHQLTTEPYASVIGRSNRFNPFRCASAMGTFKTEIAVRRGW